MCQRVEPLSGQVLCQHHQVGADPGVLGQTRVGVGEQQLHGLHAEAPGVHGGEAGSPRGQAFIGKDGRWGGRGHENPFDGPY